MTNEGTSARRLRLLRVRWRGTGAGGARSGCVAELRHEGAGTVSPLASRSSLPRRFTVHGNAAPRRLEPSLCFSNNFLSCLVVGWTCIAPRDFAVGKIGKLFRSSSLRASSMFLDVLRHLFRHSHAYPTGRRQGQHNGLAAYDQSVIRISSASRTYVTKTTTRAARLNFRGARTV